MFQVDPMASKYGSITPYNYSLNNPTNMNDPLGDDVEPQPQTPREYICAMCWRNSNDLVNYMRVSGGGMSGYGGWSGGGFYGGSRPMGPYWHPGDDRYFWSGYESYARGLRFDADRVRFGEMTHREYGRKYGLTIEVEFNGEVNYDYKEEMRIAYSEGRLTACRNCPPPSNWPKNVPKDAKYVGKNQYKEYVYVSPSGKTRYFVNAKGESYSASMERRGINFIEYFPGGDKFWGTHMGQDMQSLHPILQDEKKRGYLGDAFLDLMDMGEIIFDYLFFKKPPGPEVPDLLIPPGPPQPPEKRQG